MTFQRYIKLYDFISFESTFLFGTEPVNKTGEKFRVL